MRDTGYVVAVRRMVAIAAVLAGCRGTFELPQPPAEHQEPIADAGTAGTFRIHAVVSLDGSGSFSPVGSPLTYHWDVTSAPSGTTAAIGDQTAMVTQVTLDDVGHYVFRLTVTDDAGGTSTSDATFVVVPEPITVDAGPPRSMDWRQTIALQGSVDGQGVPATVHWTIDARPGHSTATLKNADTLVPSLFADAAGTYKLTLHATTEFDNGTSSVDVTATAAAQILPFTILAADYSTQLDRMIAISDNPPALHIVDVTTATDTSVTLAHVPAAVALDSTGLKAAIGQDQFVTIVNLQNLAQSVIETDVDAQGLVFASSGRVHIVPRPSPGVTAEFRQMSTLTITTKTTVLANASAWTPSTVRMFPDATRMYLSTTAAPPPQSLVRYDLASLVVTEAEESNAVSGGALFVTANNDVALTALGEVLFTNPSTSVDLEHFTDLPKAGIAAFAGLADARPAGRVAVASTFDDALGNHACLSLFDDSELEPIGSLIPIPDPIFEGIQFASQPQLIRIDDAATQVLYIVTTPGGSAIYTIDL